MRNAADEQALRTLVIDNSSLFVESGVTTALAVVKVADKDNLVKCVALHHVLLKVKAEIDQFCTGLRALGVLDAMQASPHLFVHYFCLDGMQFMKAGKCCV